ncbi:hypothetical protein [Sulfurimonas sp.]|uniref:hypothetical protein n=1 Tax=Sulfurimonas sp. TaxID=2022749 RepID=UPI0035684CE5
MKSLNYGIDLFQGYLFAHPSADAPDRQDILETIQHVGYKHRYYLESITKQKNNFYLEASDISQKIISMINTIEIAKNKEILELIKQEKKIEALYLIDAEESKQVGETIFLAEQKSFYEPSADGEDHSLKEYFYICKNSIDGKFISEKYISSASGNMCRTFTRKFSYDDKELILCLDLYLSSQSDRRLVEKNT